MIYNRENTASFLLCSEQKVFVLISSPVCDCFVCLGRFFFSPFRASWSQGNLRAEIAQLVRMIDGGCERYL